MKIRNKLYACLGKIKSYKWELAALALVMVMLSFFVSQKEGYHMDELLSFELSNAEYNPWIVPTQPQGRLAKFVQEEIDGETIAETYKNIFAVVKDVVENKGGSLIANYRADIYDEPIWINRKQFTEYITVDKTDDFNYLSVYFNVKDDNHPPIHFMLLHTVSSLFKEKINPWMGCIINMLAILGCSILLMKICNLLGFEKRYGIMAVLLYGMSSGGVATTLLIRMYGVMTLFCVWALYLHLKKWKSDNWKKENKLLAIVTVLGFLTQYFFLFYILALAAITVICLCATKKRKEIFYYIRTMLIAAIIGVCAFPFAISDVLFSGRGVEAIDNLKEGFHGYGERLASFGKVLVQSMPGGIVGAVLAIGLLVFWIYRIISKKEQKNTTDIVVWMMLGVPFVIYFLLAAKMSPYIVDRYIMPIFPVMTLLIVCIYERCSLSIRGGLLIALCLGIFTGLAYNGEYLFKGYAAQEQVSREYESLPCVCVYEGYGFYKNLMEFTNYEETLLVTFDELKQRNEDAVIDENNQVIVLVKGEIDKNLLAQLLTEKYSYQVTKELIADGVHGDSVWLCER